MEMRKIKEHYRNGRNWGDSWYFITKMMLTGNLLTDEKYFRYMSGIMNKDKNRGETK
jgi:hypothetical protein